MGAAIVGALFGPVLGGIASVVGTGAGVRERRGARSGARHGGAADPRSRPSIHSRSRAALRGAPRPGDRRFDLVRARSPRSCSARWNVLGPLRLDVLGLSALAIGATWLVAASFEAALSPVIGRSPTAAGARSAPRRPDRLGRRGGRRCPGSTRAGCSRRDRPRGVRVRQLLDAGDVAARRPCRGDRARLRVRVRADQPRVGAGSGGGLGARRRRGARDDSAAVPTLIRLCVLLTLARLEAGDPQAPRRPTAARSRSASFARAASSASRPSPSRRRTTAARCTPVPRTRRSRSRRTSRPRSTSARPAVAAPTRSTPATASWRRTPTSRARSRRRG